ncbi:hypothetical protein M1M52_gp39 [uncultured phage cr54_1]|jgi:hypothetical protein|uniref:Uncharacterized protein n=1 Tax=uncultured phage cr54_1 TaxID=2986398 RepID=A0AAE7S1G2_9CAUD|nr:hypothetical protein M1M52_gp39 [uncultured phage cr54_1]QWM89975.1 hypothetical protein [uncultured phage cr54_1]
MRIFGTDYMKLKIVRNNTRKETIICQSLTDSSVDYVYESEFNKRKWSLNDDIEVLVDNRDIEIGGDLSLSLQS